MESGWLWQTAQSHQRQLIDEAARQRRLADAHGTSIARWNGARSWAALRLRRIADWLEPPVQPRIGLLRAVAHHELDVEQALRLLPARPLTARR